VPLTHHNVRGDTTNVAVKIRLKRLGKIRVPQYRIVIVDSRKKRDGRVIEEIGKYHPKEHPSYIDVVSDRAQYWLGVGAQPSEAVEKLLKITGDWQKFKGLPGTEGTLRVKDAKRSKLDIFNDALKEAGSEPAAEAVTRKSGAKKAEKAPVAPAEEAPVAPAEEASAEKAPAADKAPAEEAPAAEKAPADKAPAEEAPVAPAEVPADETPEGAAEIAQAEADNAAGTASEA
jgi:small subunit ribosomal protein S16